MQILKLMVHHLTSRFSQDIHLISQAGNRQLDDKDEYTVATDNIARAVTNLEYEYNENEKKREIDVLKKDMYKHL